MSLSLLEEQRTSQPTPLRTPTFVVDRVEPDEPRLRFAQPSVTTDEEITFVKKVVLWMLFLSITPLFLFLIVNYFHPELFLTPIAPNKAGVTP